MYLDVTTCNVFKNTCISELQLKKMKTHISFNSDLTSFLVNGKYLFHLHPLNAKWKFLVI